MNNNPHKTEEMTRKYYDYDSVGGGRTDREVINDLRSELTTLRAELEEARKYKDAHKSAMLQLEEERAENAALKARVETIKKRLKSFAI